MHFLTYFLGIGATLTAMLFVVDASYERPAEMPFASASVEVPSGSAAAPVSAQRSAFWAQAPDSVFAENKNFALASAKDAAAPAQHANSDAVDAKVQAAAKKQRVATEAKRRVQHAERYEEMRPRQYARQGGWFPFW